jgi:hypothetical protein
MAALEMGMFIQSLLENLVFRHTSDLEARSEYPGRRRTSSNENP